MGHLPLWLCSASSSLHADLQIRLLDRENHSLQLTQRSCESFTICHPLPHLTLCCPFTPANISPLSSSPCPLLFSAHIKAGIQKTGAKFCSRQAKKPVTTHSLREVITQPGFLYHSLLCELMQVKYPCWASDSSPGKWEQRTAYLIDM